MKKLIALIALFPAEVFAQVVASSPVPAATPAVITAIANANTGLSSHAGSIVIGLGIVAEIAMRVWPTKNPMSFFTLAAVALTGLATLCSSAAGILNNVVTTKTPSA